MLNNKYISLFILSISLLSCSENAKQVDSDNLTATSFEVSNFIPISDSVSKINNIYSIELDYTDAMANGFVIPSVAQNKEGVFNFSFNIKNNTGKDGEFVYKLYYQNESYKFNEVIENSNNYNSLSQENFYGSWEDSLTGFKVTQQIPADGKFHKVSDFFRIVGNPRNEQRYFSNGKNDRWKRNPRVGNYSVMLVVTTRDIISEKKLPEYIQYINLPEHDNTFLNPYYYFLYSGRLPQEDVIVINSGPVLNVKASPDPGAGVYIDPFNFNKDQFGQYFNDSCGQDSVFYHTSAFEQFINNVDPSMRFENIPVVRDIMSDDYTQTDYNWDKAFYKLDEMVSVLPGIARRPCETVYSDPVNHKIIMKNPGTVQGVYRKESVGIRTRHGFTYGKYRLKCKLTELLNKNNVWNGLTNAIWLLSQQGSGPWNNRRSCDKEGYMASYWGGDNDKRVPIVDYSEIDFEILKTPPYCPPENFPPVIKNPVNDQYNIDRWNVSLPDELQEAAPLITVACTNWDMACKQPEDFNSGCNEIAYGDKVFSSHRWTDYYRALTQKKYAPDDELFASDFYYFEIEWKPQEIIWRIGPSPDKMQVVGYMNDKVTSIPNNQMTLIVTQEYHNTKWWPGSPFTQENIPFPGKDIIGEIYELVIE